MKTHNVFFYDEISYKIYLGTRSIWNYVGNDIFTIMIYGEQTYGFYE